MRESEILDLDYNFLIHTKDHAKIVYFFNNKINSLTMLVIRIELDKHFRIHVIQLEYPVNIWQDSP